MTNVTTRLERRIRSYQRRDKMRAIARHTELPVLLIVFASLLYAFPPTRVAMLMLVQYAM